MISDDDWNEFVDNNIVSDDVIKIIVEGIKCGREKTDREIAIYKEHSELIEKIIRNG